MELIKLLSIISFFPLLRTIRKIMRKDDITCIDLILLFYTIYFAAIPLLGNTDKIDYVVVKENSAIHWYIFVLYNSFAYLMVYIDILMCKKKQSNSIFYITRYLRKWMLANNVSNYIFILLMVLVAIEIYSISSDVSSKNGMVQGSMEIMREAMKEKNNPVQMIINSGMSIIRMAAIVLFFFLFSKMKNGLANEKYRLLLCALCFCQMCIQLFISRTYLIESVSLLFILWYSTEKESLSLKDCIKYFAIILICIVAIFPIISGLRAVKSSIYQGDISDFFDLALNGADLVLSGNIDYEALDNKDSRMWNVYQIMGLTYQYDYEGYGEIMKNAFIIGIPKTVLPTKSQLGSQGIIEKELNIYDDVADSVLLAGVMESRVFGCILAALFFMLLIRIHDLFILFFSSFFHSILSIPLIVSSLFMWINRVEFSIDGYVNFFLILFIWNCLLYYISLLAKKITKHR